MKILILDCETATLPFVREWELSPKDKQKIGLAKPLVYDAGWTVFDTSTGVTIKKASYLVQETFFVPNIFNTAYYRDKRELYFDKLAAGEIKANGWNMIAAELLVDCQMADYVAAYNAMFDFIKAIPFTERYIKNLYSPNYNRWEYGQRKACEAILAGDESKDPVGVDTENFHFRDHVFPMIDVWAVACTLLVNQYSYKYACARFPLLSNSGRYFKTSAEAVFRFLKSDYNFDEEHTALADAEIETEILYTAIQTGQEIPTGVSAFPFRELGTTCAFLSYEMENHPGNLKPEAVLNVLDIMESYCDTIENIYTNTFAAHLMKEVRELNRLFNSVYSEKRKDYCPDFELMKQYRRKARILKHVKDKKKRAELHREMGDLAEQIMDLNFYPDESGFVPVDETQEQPQKATITVSFDAENPPSKKDLTDAVMRAYSEAQGAGEWYDEAKAGTKTARTRKGKEYETTDFKELRELFLRRFFGEE